MAVRRESSALEDRGSRGADNGKIPAGEKKTENSLRPEECQGAENRKGLTEEPEMKNMAQEPSGEAAPPLSVEESFEALEALIERLESGEGSLEEAFKDYEEGMRLVKSCNDRIERIEKQVLILSGEEGENDVIEFH